MNPNSPQAKEMADESMLRTLAAQAEAIWPQEEPIFARHPPRAGGEVLDVGCGTGEITARLARMFPDATFIGTDLEEQHLGRAATRCAEFGRRVRFEPGDALSLPFGDATFDLVVCRHLLQAVPDEARVLTEIRRVLRPGGRMHLIPEDYGMLWFHPTGVDSNAFWQSIPAQLGAAMGFDPFVGRKTFTLLYDLSMTEVTADYIAVDTLRVPRETFARIIEAWRDGYAGTMALHTSASREQIDETWRTMIGCIRDPRGYALWQVPVWTAVKSG